MYDKRKQNDLDYIFRRRLVENALSLNRAAKKWFKDRNVFTIPANLPDSVIVDLYLQDLRRSEFEKEFFNG